MNSYVSCAEEEMEKMCEIMVKDINDKIGNVPFKFMPHSLIHDLMEKLNPDAHGGADWRALAEIIMNWTNQKIQVSFILYVIIYAGTCGIMVCHHSCIQTIAEST